MAHTPDNGRPSVYAAGKLGTMRLRWAGAAGDAVRAMAAGAGWPGTPPEALLGVTSNSGGASDDTTATRRFHEIGLFQLPAGPVSSPPNRDPSGPYNIYASLAGDARVRALLGGRSASLDDWASDVPGQVATGLVSLADDRDALSGLLGAAGYRDAGSQWALALGVLSYVLGPGGADHAVHAAARAVAAVPEDARLGAMIENLCAAPPANAPPRSWGYPVVRAWQRLATGRALALAVGTGNGPWFDLGLGADAPEYERCVSTAAYARDGHAPTPVVPAAELGAGGALALAGAGAIVYRLARGRWPFVRR